MPENRKIIQIDEEKCDGCGLCIPACAEGALQIIDGKARLVEDRYCDGLGDCLGECPAGAIKIIEREAEPFDQAAVDRHLQKLRKEQSMDDGFSSVCAGTCPGARERDISAAKPESNTPVDEEREGAEPEPELGHWPIQLELVSPQSRFLKGKELLIAADCVPFAYADFHYRFLRGRSLLIGCPKLDDQEAFRKKLVDIFKYAEVKKITVLHMEVPCCHALSRMIHSALLESEIDIPVEETVIGVDGTIKQ